MGGGALRRLPRSEPSPGRENEILPLVGEWYFVMQSTVQRDEHVSSSLQLQAHLWEMQATRLVQYKNQYTTIENAKDKGKTNAKYNVPI